MAKLSVKEIQTLAKRMVAETPGGIRYSALVQRIAMENPETPKNTIHGSVWDLATRFPNEITKPSRGLFLPAPAAGGAVSVTVTPPVLPLVKIKEDDFYEPFADWLKNELDEATVAIALGGTGLQKKWGTPDVIGVYKALASHRIKFDLEIISAEIKIDPQQPVIAFGQAAAYRLFSAKSYIVMPNSISEEDYSRLEALCMLFGIGLVLFETNPEEPAFKIRVRAQRRVDITDELRRYVLYRFREDGPDLWIIHGLELGGHDASEKACGSCRRKWTRPWCWSWITSCTRYNGEIPNARRRRHARRTHLDRCRYRAGTTIVGRVPEAARCVRLERQDRGH